MAKKKKAMKVRAKKEKEEKKVVEKLSKSIRLPSIPEQLKTMQEEMTGIKQILAGLETMKKRIANLEEVSNESCCEETPRLLQRTTTQFPNGTRETKETFA